MSLRCLLSDELSNVALQLRKLVGTKHPLLKTAKRFIYDGTHTLQTRGLLVLLISKAAGQLPNTQGEVIENMVSGISQSQRILAEIAEMIHTAYLVHRGVVNLENITPADGPLKDMEFGNKMAVLSGDFLLANASTSLAKLQNTKVVEVIASAIQDLMCSEFSVFVNREGRSLMPENGVSMQDWENQTFLASGSLLAKSCRSAMMLAGHSEAKQEEAFNFGRNMAFTYQIREDLDIIEKRLHEELNALSAPTVLYYLANKEDTEFRHLLTDTRSNHKQICNKLVSSGSVEEAKRYCRIYGHSALESLHEFEDSEAKAALVNIVKAITR